MNAPSTISATELARDTTGEAGSTRGVCSLKEEVFRKIEVIRAIAKSNGARSIHLFGSAARGAEKAGSDLDFLVELEPGSTLLDVVGLRAELSQLFDRPVDVVTRDSLKPSLRSAALRNAIPVIA